jgi:uncharacterized repeat protein (TIGR01451 family)
MGTRSSRRHRGTRRGLASFVSFVVLFALALGQGSSLIAWADDAGTGDPVATGEVAADGASADTTLPAEEAPAEEAPAEEAPAEEAPAEAPAEDAPAEEASAEEAPAEESPAQEAPADDSSASSSGGAGGTRALKSARSPQGGAVIQSHGGLHGGDVNLDFVAAGPFTYDHSTGLGVYPDFGYNDRTIDKDSGVVESLEGGDFACGDLVTFFVEVEVEEGAGSGSVALDLSFGAETTGQPGLGFDDIVSWGINTPDDGNVGLDGPNTIETVTLTNEHLDTSGYDTVKGTFTVSNLEGGETAIVRVTVRLACEVGASPTGNILNAIDAARVVGGETISVGQETVPLKQVGGIAAEPGIAILKSCPDASLDGEDITYEIIITNTGNEDLENVEVSDTVNGNDSVDISDLFPDTLDAGDSFTAEWTYEADGTEPDPLPNSVTVTATGVTSDVAVTDTDSCQTDILNPNISITKTCPATALDGDDVTYTITIQNIGDEALDNVEVWDTVNGNDPVDLSGLFPDTLAVGSAAVTVEWTYEADGTEPDPLPNSVTVTATGVTSDAEVEDTAGCQTDITHVPGIDVTKSCPALVAFGEDITYTITVTNTGNEPLVGVTVNDTLLGNITGDFDFDFSEPFPVGEVATAVVTYSPGAEEDPVFNSVTAIGIGADSEVQATDTAVCTTDISNPAIRIVKTVSEETVPVGTTVTYTYVITNTGDVTLFDISVDDDIMGHIGDIPVLEPGFSVTLTKDFVVGDEPVLNVGTAVGEDILGRVVRDDDDAFVTPILGNNPPNPPNPPNTPPTTPFTGSDAGRLGLITIVLFGIGVTVVASTHRRRQEREAA